MFLRPNGHTATGDALLDTDLRDLEIVVLNGRAYLYTTTGQNGGMAAFEITAGGLQEVDRAYFAASYASSVSGTVEFVTTGGTPQLVFGATDYGLLSIRIDPGGGLGAVTQIGSSPVPAGGGAIYAVRSDGSLVAHTTGDLRTYTVSGTVELAQIAVGNQTFVVATNPDANAVTSYRVLVTGATEYAGSVGADDGVGIAAPIAMHTVQAFGQSWAIVASSDSSSISVMRLDATGALTPTDHVIDTLGTRFGNVQALVLAQQGDRVFVIAGGGDDGLSLFTLLPDGHLLHLQSLPHNTGGGLMNVTDLEAAIVGGALRVFVASGTERGLTGYTMPLDRLGMTLRDVTAGGQVLTGGHLDDLIAAGASGRDTLRGGAGNDILLGSASGSDLTGGAGADRFVLRQGSQTTRITDFSRSEDSIDMSDFLMLRSPGQLTVRTTANGATILFRDALIEVTSATGTPLTMTDLFGSGFDWPDRVLVLATPPGMQIVGTGADEFIAGGAGPDSIDGGGGNDAIWARGGNDLLHGSWGSDDLGGQSGDDTLIGGWGRDTLSGGTGHDSLVGEQGADQLWGADGNDVLSGGSGDDVLGGGAGNDALDGGEGRDGLWGGAGNDTLRGGRGNDSLGGYHGDDLLYGGAGADELWGNIGNDLAWGGSGDDTIGSGGGADTIRGDGGRDEIWGAAGEDLLYGGTGNDLIGGGGDNDVLYGEAGRDSLYGGGGERPFVRRCGCGPAAWGETAMIASMVTVATTTSGVGTATTGCLEGLAPTPSTSVPLPAKTRSKTSLQEAM